MTDPLSVASSAVGIISLGLQACKGIVSYCEAWRGYDEDIQRISTKSNELRLSLHQLRALIEDPHLNDPEILKDLEGTAFSLQTKIVKLHETIEKFKPALSDSVHDKIRAQMKKASYPFRKDTLREIENDLHGMHIVLQTTLGIYSLRKTAEIGTVSETILGIVEEMRLTLCNYSPKDPPPPGLLRSCCDRQHGLDQLMAQSRSETRVKPVIRTYRYYSHLLGCAFTASFWRPTGAGGFSIAPPLLNVRQVIDLEGWPVYLFRNLIKWDCLDHDNEIHINSFLAWLQQEFEEKNYNPAYDLCLWSQSISIIDLLAGRLSWFEFYNYREFCGYLLNCGSIPESNSSSGAFSCLLKSPKFGQAEYVLISEFVERGGPIGFFEFDWHFRQNIRYILSRNDELVAFPEIVKILIRESEDELTHALDTQKHSVIENFPGEYSMLDFAFGWPRGVQMLVDRGLALDGTLEWDSWYILMIDMGDNFPGLDGHCESAKILISAGWKWYDPSHTLLFCESKRLRALFIDDLVAQRKALWRQAQQFLSIDELPILEEGSVLDADASRVYAALVSQRKTVDSRHVCGQFGTSVYHTHDCDLSIQKLDQLYQAGFRDIDSVNLQGMSPIIFQLRIINLSCENFSWFVSKGANPFRRLPRSSATAIHLLSQQLASSCAWVDHSLSDIDLSSDFCGGFLSSTIRDDCVCACSPGGCSILKVALDHDMKIVAGHHSVKRDGLLSLLQNLIHLHKSTSDVDQTIIRFFTFDGLGVQHTCCIDSSEHGQSFPLTTRDWREVREIQEEEKPRLNILEELVTEFEAKHAELGLPILEFLEKHWKPRMLEYLSQRDPYDEEHHRECKELGIFLESEEDDIPDRTSLLIGPRLIEVEDEA